MQRSRTLEALLAELRQHPAFQELLKAVHRPQPPQFKVSQAQEADAFGALAIYASGKRAQHEMWLALLTGQPPKENYD